MHTRDCRSIANSSLSYQRRYISCHSFESRSSSGREQSLVVRLKNDLFRFVAVSRSLHSSAANVNAAIISR